MLFEDQLWLNKVAQGVIQIDRAVAEFSGLGFDRRRELLHALTVMVQQASVTESDKDTLMREEGLNPRWTAMVLISKEVRRNFYKLWRLPEGEQPNALKVLLSLFRSADSRRRATRCHTQCSHWWHRNLADEEVIRSIIQDHTMGHL